MLDIKLIREQPELVKDGMAKVGQGPAIIDHALALDAEWRSLTSRAEELKAERNRVSKEIGKAADGEERQAKIAAMRKVGDDIQALDTRISEVRDARGDVLLRIPNMPHADAPVGDTEEANVVVRIEGEIPKFDFEPKPHWEIGPALGILDFERGVKLSGSRFYVLLGDGARLQRALITYMLDLHTLQHGYTEALPPYIVTEKCLVGTGNLPKFDENLYRDVEDDLWLIPTAEVPLTNLHRDEILDEADLPKYYVAFTACFRREKMSAGKDVRGIKRGHQFDKVEMMKYVLPDQSDAELLTLLDNAEDVCRGLGLPYRVVEMCTGDLSFVACRKFDIETWAVGCDEWLEVSSCGNFRDFQARRANLRYRPADGAKSPQFLHTLNGSGLALPRIMISVLENYQQADGSVVIPEVLRPYMGGQEKIVARQ
jgi:seryl-tRNA synthetase